MSLITFIHILASHLKNTYRKWPGRAPVPYKWLIQLTNDCNSRCQYCDIWKINKDHPEKKDQESSIKDYQSLFESSGHNLKWLSLSGGEITLYQHISEFGLLVKNYASNLRLITFTTNGIHSEKILETARKLRSLAPDMFVVISLDGNEELHDKLRGVPGNYQKAQQSYQLLKANGFNVYFGSTLNNQNADWPELNTGHIKSISLAHSQGIFEKENQINDHKLSISLEQIVKSYRIKSLAELGEYLYLKLGVSFLKNKRTTMPIPCDSLSSSLHISPYGDIKPCMYLPEVGNIKNNTLAECLNGEKAQLMRERIRKEECPKCWMNCYAPHSILQSPIKTLKALVK